MFLIDSHKATIGIINLVFWIDLFVLLSIYVMQPPVVITVVDDNLVKGFHLLSKIMLFYIISFKFYILMNIG